MNSKVAFILGTIIGAGIGVIGTYSYFKDKYEKLAEEDFNSRRVFDEDKKDESEEPVVEKTADSRTVDKRLMINLYFPIRKRRKKIMQASDSIILLKRGI